MGVYTKTQCIQIEEKKPFPLKDQHRFKKVLFNFSVFMKGLTKQPLMRALPQCTFQGMVWLVCARLVIPAGCCIRAIMSVNMNKKAA